jgi:hypothetical protein
MAPLGYICCSLISGADAVTLRGCSARNALRMVVGVAVSCRFGLRAERQLGEARDRVFGTLPHLPVRI